MIDFIFIFLNYDTKFITKKLKLFVIWQKAV